MHGFVPPQKRRRIGRLADLPARIRGKIELEIEGQAERDTCWCWTGGARSLRQRHKAYSVASGYDGFRQSTHRIVTERLTPEVRDPFTKKKTAAYRVVYALATGVSIDDVSELGRCANDRCVNPHHVRIKGPTKAQRKRLEVQSEALDKNEQRILSSEEVLSIIKSKRPYAQIDDLSAIDEECNLPLGSTTQEIAINYYNWDAENDND